MCSTHLGFTIEAISNTVLLWGRSYFLLDQTDCELTQLGEMKEDRGEGRGERGEGRRVGVSEKRNYTPQ